MKLKFLYVAITRARKNLWVVDRSEKAEPMRVRYLILDLIFAEVLVRFTGLDVMR